MAVGNIYEPDHVNSILMAGARIWSASPGRIWPTLLDAARRQPARLRQRRVAEAVFAGADQLRRLACADAARGRLGMQGRVQGAGCRAGCCKGAGCGVQGAGCRVQGAGCRCGCSEHEVRDDAVGSTPPRARHRRRHRHRRGHCHGACGGWGRGDRRRAASRAARRGPRARAGHRGRRHARAGLRQVDPVGHGHLRSDRHRRRQRRRGRRPGGANDLALWQRMLDVNLTGAF